MFQFFIKLIFFSYNKFWFLWKKVLNTALWITGLHPTYKFRNECRLYKFKVLVLPCLFHKRGWFSNSHEPTFALLAKWSCRVRHTKLVEYSSTGCSKCSGACMCFTSIKAFCGHRRNVLHDLLLENLYRKGKKNRQIEMKKLFNAYWVYLFIY